MADTDAPSLEQLQAQFEDARGNPDFTSEQVMEIALQINATKKLVAKVERDAETAAAKAEHDAKMQEVNPLMQIGETALKMLLDEVRDKFVAAGIHSITLSAKDMHTDSMLTNVKAGGPGLPSTKGVGVATGTKRGRNVYTYEGEEYGTHDFLDRFGHEHFGDKTLQATGLSHRADALAEKLGAAKTKRVNGDS